MFQAPISKLAKFSLRWAFLCAAVAAAAGPAYQLEFLDLRGAMLALTGGVAGGALAVLLGALAVRATLGLGGKRGRGRAVAAMAVGVLVVAIPSPYFLASVTSPAIHDLSTDTEDPPAFVALADDRAAAPHGVDYPGERASMLQAAAYPEVAPAIYPGVNRDEVFRAVKASAEELGWQVVAADSAAGQLEATDRSFWFGFIDDVVIRVRETDDGVRVDIRSASRLGESDLGANAERIGRFFAEMDRRL